MFDCLALCVWLFMFRPEQQLMHQASLYVINRAQEMRKELSLAVDELPAARYQEREVRVRRRRDYHTVAWCFGQQVRIYI